MLCNVCIHGKDYLALDYLLDSLITSVPSQLENQEKPGKGVLLFSSQGQIREFEKIASINDKSGNLIDP